MKILVKLYYHGINIIVIIDDDLPNFQGLAMVNDVSHSFSTICIYFFIVESTPEFKMTLYIQVIMDINNTV